MSNPQPGFLSGLTSAARDNPLAAILVGGGALWLLAGGDGLKSAASSVGGAMTPVMEVGARRLRKAAAERRRNVEAPATPEAEKREKPEADAQPEAEGSADTVSAATGTIKTRLDEGARYAREKIGAFGNPLPGRESLARAQSLLADALERQPLALGIAGVALGGAIASAFRASNLENEWLGGASAGLKADLSARAADVSDAVRQTSDRLKSEAGEAGAEAVDRVKQAAIDAANAAGVAAKAP